MVLTLFPACNVYSSALLATDDASELEGAQTGGAPAVSTGGTSAPGGQSAGSSGSGGLFQMAAGGGEGSGGDTAVGATGGEAGGSPTSDCQRLPLTSRSQWRASASSFAFEPPLNDSPDRAIDGSFTTRWSSGQAMSPSDWFEIDFGGEIALTRLTLHHDGLDHARAYEILVSSSPLEPSARPVRSGTNDATVLELRFEEPLILRYMRIRQTGSTGNWWSLAEVSVACDD